MRNQAFTLVELLIVVLIIGILAAIALPQYRVIVTKTRISTFLPLLKSIVEAEEVFYLNNNKYAYSIDELDIHIPASCKKIDSWNNNEVFRCEHSTQLFIGGSRNNDESLQLDYCPSHYAEKAADCYSNAEVGVIYRYKHFDNVPNEEGERYCFPRTNSSLGHKVCKNLTGSSVITRDGYRF